MLDLLTEVILCRLLHLREDHGRHLLGGHHLVAALDLHADHRLAALICDEERQQLDVLLHGGVLEPATDQPLDVEEGLRGVDRRLVLCRLADQPLVVGEGDVRGSDAVSLVVRDDLDPAVLVDADAGVRRPQVDADDRPVDLLLLRVLRRHEAGEGKQAESKELPQHGQNVLRPLGGLPTPTLTSRSSAAKAKMA
mmetsp:Transcript_96513/g.300539  ORF Transcript_96513/g.300539 Transcript_96513/m.300539 type:complete len:195 (-) Transcript_96513:2-586(-)